MSDLVGQAVVGIYTRLRSDLGFDFEDPLAVHMIPLVMGTDSAFVIFR